MVMRQPAPSFRKRERFSSTDHLGPEAVAAFADHELSSTALHRARVHVVQCEECRAEVNHQRAAAEKLRNCNVDDAVHAPLSLVQKICQLPAEPVETAHDNSRPVADLMSVAYRALKTRGFKG